VLGPEKEQRTESQFHLVDIFQEPCRVWMAYTARFSVPSSEAVTRRHWR